MKKLFLAFVITVVAIAIFWPAPADAHVSDALGCDQRILVRVNEDGVNSLSYRLLMLKQDLCGLIKLYL